MPTALGDFRDKEVTTAGHGPREGQPGQPLYRSKSMKVLQVLRLPRKTSRRCSKCCACHAKRAWGAPSAAPATQNEAEPKGITRRQTSADLYMKVLRVLRLPRKTRRRPKASLVARFPPTSIKALQVLRLPRNTRPRPTASLVARLPPTSMKVLQVLRLPRKMSLRCSKCCACHAKRTWGAPSAAHATQNEPEVLQVL